MIKRSLRRQKYWRNIIIIIKRDVNLSLGRVRGEWKSHPVQESIALAGSNNFSLNLNLKKEKKKMVKMPKLKRIK